MVTSKWDTATGEIVVRMDAQTAHELVKFLQRQRVNTKELIAVLNAVTHTTQSPRQS